MKFELEQNEAAGLINLIGQLPTNSGVYPILTKLVEQYKAQESASESVSVPAAE